jgi:carbamoyl-phosphate synthase small subunit
MTYPLIGNCGTTTDDYEMKQIWCDAIFIHELAPLESNFRSKTNLNKFLIKNKIPGLKKVNTRKLTKVLREQGTMRGMLTDDISDIPSIIQKIKEYNPTTDKITTKEIYTVGRMYSERSAQRPTLLFILH